jgi:hypothetical protein
MMRAFLPLLASAALLLLPATGPRNILHAERSSAGDLEVGGELAGLPAGATRYIRYEDLLKLPQQTYTESGDSNLAPGTRIGGVPLEDLARLLRPSQNDALIVAVCDDRYQAHYPRAYVAAHHPLLVLRIDGELRDHWPHARDGGTLGPYLISHPFFKPSFKVLSHEDEPQIPYGVVRLEFHDESRVYGSIHPRGKWSAGSPVEQGYIIARQDCFRCHNNGDEGGAKAGRSWMQLASCARRNPELFRKTIHDPASINPKAAMPAHKDYDEATLEALTAYFMTFAPTGGKQ